MAQVGEPQREFIIEPLELPEPLRPERKSEPSWEPQEEPAYVENRT